MTARRRAEPPWSRALGEEPRCALCGRVGVALTEHHLVPRERDGADGPTADLCGACHGQIHRLFDNRRLASELASLEALRREPELARFVTWVRKQDPGRRIAVRRPRRRRR